MAAGVTYSSIATFTSTGSSNTIVFSSIPQTYTDLVLIIDGLGPTTYPYFDVQFNTDTSGSSTNYSFTRMMNTGTTTYSDRYQNFFSIEPSIGETDRGYILMNFMNYRNTNMFKNVFWRDGNKGSALDIGLWRDTSAIDTITLKGGNSANIPSGTNFTLYGIEAA